MFILTSTFIYRSSSSEAPVMEALMSLLHSLPPTPKTDSSPLLVHFSPLEPGAEGRGGVFTVANTGQLGQLLQGTGLGVLQHQK